MQEKLDRLQEVKRWEEQRSHLCNLIAWEAVHEQQVTVESCEHVLNGSAKDKIRQVQHMCFLFLTLTLTSDAVI